MSVFIYSTVRFTLDEILRGEPATVVGTGSQVSGEIAIDFNQPANSEIGVILVNARMLVTDNDFRNRAINNSILETGKYEFITFTPTQPSSTAILFAGVPVPPGTKAIPRFTLRQKSLSGS
jgi:polyisoprenoid-binding protein YceI